MVSKKMVQLHILPMKRERSFPGRWETVITSCLGLTFPAILTLWSSFCGDTSSIMSITVNLMILTNFNTKSRLSSIDTMWTHAKQFLASLLFQFRNARFASELKNSAHQKSCPAFLKCDLKQKLLLLSCTP